MKKRLIIGFGSKAKIGKDRAFQLLSTKYDTKRITFADLVKSNLAELLRQKHSMDLYKLLANPDDKEKIRPLLAAYGDSLRSFNPNVWINAALGGRKFNNTLTVITDVRYVNEAQAIKELGGYYIAIKTNTAPANVIEQVNSAEVDKLADYILENNFDDKFTEDLFSLVDTLLNK